MIFVGKHKLNTVWFYHHRKGISAVSFREPCDRYKRMVIPPGNTDDSIMYTNDLMHSLNIASSYV